METSFHEEERPYAARATRRHRWALIPFTDRLYTARIDENVKENGQGEKSEKKSRKKHGTSLPPIFSQSSRKLIY